MPGSPMCGACRRTWNPTPRGHYVNFQSQEQAGHRVLDPEAVLGATKYERLAVKRRYDPDNTFHVNHNIPTLKARAPPPAGRTRSPDVQQVPHLTDCLSRRGFGGLLSSRQARGTDDLRPKPPVGEARLARTDIGP